MVEKWSLQIFKKLMERLYRMALLKNKIDHPILQQTRDGWKWPHSRRISRFWLPSCNHLACLII